MPVHRAAVAADTEPGRAGAAAWRHASPLQDQVEAISFDGHLVLVRGEHEIMVLNETARLIWDEIAAGVAAADVARGIAARFGVPSERARVDVETARLPTGGHGA